MEAPKSVQMQIVGTACRAAADPNTEFAEFCQKPENPMSIHSETIADMLNKKTAEFPSQQMMHPDICTIEPAKFMASGCREGVHCMPGEGSKREQTEVPIEELIPYSAYCCNIESCFCGFPSCLGCSGTEMVCCYMCSYACCKCLDCSDEDSKCCALCENKCFCKIPQNCCYVQRQLCCLDQRMEFPCGAKMPCVCGYFFIMCCAEYKCIGCRMCQKLGTIVPRLNEAAGKPTGDDP